ncbi:MAG: hypothetical protein IKW92_04765 [Firmicutes bacterium]|nr:hypothetical protein [Bacillota bacterium]
MKKKSVIGILAAVICAVALIYIFLWPHPLYDIAWLGVSHGEPDIVRIVRDAFGEEAPLTYDVTLSDSDSAAFLEDMRNASVRFPFFGRMDRISSDYYRIMLGNQNNVWSEIEITNNGTINQEAPANRRWGNGTFLLYRKDAEGFLQICREWTSPDGRYPGLAFLQEFFAINKDGRADNVWLDAPDGVYSTGDSIFALYQGLERYMTERGFSKILMERSLYKLEYVCKQKGKDWYCGSIEVAPASEPGNYFYSAVLVEGASGNNEEFWITGNYSIGEDGLVDSFYIDLSGEILKED